MPSFADGDPFRLRRDVRISEVWVGRIDLSAMKRTTANFGRLNIGTAGVA
jgi:hypothetical protein